MSDTRALEENVLLLEDVRDKDQVIAYLFAMIQESVAHLISTHELEFADKIVARGKRIAEIYALIVERTA
jgi:ABC-type polar amino acid transport system ATPase subunit